MSLTFSGAVPVPSAQSSPLSILVTGAARGIGLELVKQYAGAHKKNIVFAGVRNVNNAKLVNEFAQSHPNVHVIPLDVSDESSIKASVKHVTSITDHVDVLLNNAGIIGADNNPSTITASDLLSVLSTNVVGPLLVVQSYLPLLQKSSQPAKIISVSSSLGSNTHGYAFGKPFISYGTSKAALNFLNTQLKHVYPNLVFISVHPGWVDTDMGNEAGKPPTTVADSAQAIIYYTQQQTLANSGRYLDVTTGEELPF